MDLRKLKHAFDRLGPNKLERAREALASYGLKECVRRAKRHLRGEPHEQAAGSRQLVISNESYINPDSRGFEERQQVMFIVGPSKDSITRIEVLTRNTNPEKPSRLHVTLTGPNGRLASATGAPVQNGVYTSVDFPSVCGVFGMPVRVDLRIEGGGGALLVHPKKARRGFTVDGGGGISCRILTQENPDPYHAWIHANEPTEEELAALGDKEAGTDGPTFAMVCLGTRETEESQMRFRESLIAQTYPNWELWTVGGQDGPDPHFHGIPAGTELVQRLDAVISADWLGFSAPDGTISPHTLSLAAREIRENNPDFIYVDEDHIDAETGVRSAPFFKPDYSPIYLLSYDYIGHFFLMKHELFDKVAQDAKGPYDVVLRALELTGAISHIPEVLYHSTKDYIPDEERARKAVSAAMQRRGIQGGVKRHSLPGFREIDYACPKPEPLVSIIIPNHNEPETIEACVRSILEKTTYKNYEIMIVENNSTEQAVFDVYEQLKKLSGRVHVETWNHPFNFASINNWAAQKASGEVLVFLNNDTTVIAPDWLGRMTALACRKDIGAVGAKLYYPDDTLQHGGVVIRMGGIAGHLHHAEPRTSNGSFGRLRVPFDVSAVTGACLAMRKSVFEEVGGFDETFVLAFNDVDLCLKIRELGLSVVMEPRAELYHYESKTRGYEVTDAQKKRFRNEQILWIRKWKDKYPSDPFYNPNLRYDTSAFDPAPEKTGASPARVRQPYDALISEELSE